MSGNLAVTSMDISNIQSSSEASIEFEPEIDHAVENCHGSDASDCAEPLEVRSDAQ